MYPVLTSFSFSFQPSSPPLSSPCSVGQELVSTVTTLCPQFYFDAYMQPQWVLLGSGSRAFLPLMYKTHLVTWWLLWFSCLVLISSLLPRGL